MMLNKLREATHLLHQQIEGENSAELIMNHSINLEQYKKLLLQNYVAYKVSEHEIKKQISNYSSDKTERLEKDLANFNTETNVAESYFSKFQISNEAEAWGAWYVVEGSSLGGMMIAKNLEECSGLDSTKEHHFFNGKRESVNGWKQYCKDLKNKNFTAGEELQAIKKAQETFLFFGKVFKEV